AAAMLAAELVSDHFEGSMNLASSVAALPSMVNAVKRHDMAAARAVLQPFVTSHPAVQRAYVVDPDGILWSDYPHTVSSLDASSSLGSTIPMYRARAQARRAAVSDVF